MANKRVVTILRMENKTAIGQLFRIGNEKKLLRPSKAEEFFSFSRNPDKDLMFYYSLITLVR